MVLRALHLCSGYGGFELALRGYARTVAHVERDAYAAATLVARMDEARLDQAPIWSDLCTFDGHPWRGRVDLITAGFPCQPFSAAGKRGGTDDDRWLWPDIARIIADVGPRYVMLENVPGVVQHGLPEVLYSLAQLGFHAEWGLLSASAVGAPHKRERFWLVAHAAMGERQPAGAERQERLRGDARRSGGADVGCASNAGRSEIPGGAHSDEGGDARWAEDAADESDCAGEDVADTDRQGFQGRRVRQHELAQRCDEDVADAARPGRDKRSNGAQPSGLPANTETSGSPLADPKGERRHQGDGPAARHRWAESQDHRYPPTPDDGNGWTDYLTAGGFEPGVRRGTNGPPSWLADALHLGGNGLVPQCAREAWEQLVGRLSR